jgi:hypothetical protein
MNGFHLAIAILHSGAGLAKAGVPLGSRVTIIKVGLI